MDIIGIIKFRIERVASNEKQKDILSILYIVWFIISVSVFIDIFGELFFSYINIFIESIKNHSIPNIDLFSVTDIINFIKLITPVTITIFYVKYFEKMKFKIEFIYMISNLVITMLLFLHTKVIIYIVLLMFLLILIIPITEGRYFSIIKKIRYFIVLYKEQDRKTDEKIFLKIVVKLLVISIICFLLSYITSSIFSLYLGFLLYITFAIRIYMDDDPLDKVLYIARKIILYTMVIVGYVILNKQLTGEIDKLLSLIIVMYFAWDRLFSISKDITELIINKSVLFYYEEENISEKDISKVYVNFNFINKEIDESNLVIQILIRFNIILYKDMVLDNYKQMKNEINILCNLYKSLNYKSYNLMVGYINIYSMEQLKEEDYLLKMEILFKDFDSNVPQKTFPLDFIFDYIRILCQRNEYEKVIYIYYKYLENYVKTLSGDKLSLLIEASSAVNDPLSNQLKKFLEN